MPILRVRGPQLLVIALVGCGVPSADELRPDPAHAATLRATPTQVESSGEQLRLVAELWRNDQPIVPLGGDSIQGMVRLERAVPPTERPMHERGDARAVGEPEALTIQRVWLVHRDQVWESRGVRNVEVPRRGAYLGSGPPWPAETIVEAIAEVVAADGRAFRVRATTKVEQLI